MGTALAIGGATLASSIIGGNAAKSAAKTTSDASWKATQLSDQRAQEAIDAVNQNYGRAYSDFTKSVQQSKGALDSGTEKVDTIIRNATNIAGAALMQGTASNIDEIRGGLERATGNITGAEGSALAFAGAGGMGAVSASKAAQRQGVMALSGAQRQAEGYLSQGLGGVEQTIGDTYNLGKSALSSGLGTARGDITASDFQAVKGLESRMSGAMSILGNVNPELQALSGGLQGSLGETELLAKYGGDAQAAEAALLGLAGPEAQAEAMQSIQVSPREQFIRDRAYGELLNNSAAMGGLGGSNVREAMMEKAAGFASTDIDKQLANLRTISERGADVSSQRAGSILGSAGATSDVLGEMKRGVAGMAADQAQMIAGIEQSTGRSLSQLASEFGVTEAQFVSNLGQTMAGAQQQTGLAGANLTQNTGMAGSNLAQNMGLAVAGFRENQGTNLAGIQERAGSARAGYEMGGAQNIASLRGSGVDSLVGYGMQGAMSRAGSQEGYATNLSNLSLAGGQGQADINMGRGQTVGNISVGAGSQAAQLALAGGQAQAAGIMGQGQAWQSGINNLAGLGTMYAMGGFNQPYTPPTYQNMFSGVSGPYSPYNY